MYFGVVDVVDVVWSSCCSFCSYTRFIIRDNQNYVNLNLREHQKNCCVCHRRFFFFNICIYFFILRVFLLLCV